MPHAARRTQWSVALAFLALCWPHAPSAAARQDASPPAGSARSREVETDPQTGRVLRFRDERGDFRYRYDANGRLLEAMREGDTVATLAWNDRNLPASLALQGLGDASRHQLAFTYDARGRVVRMRLDDRGTIAIRYGRDGEPVMRSTLNPDGHRTTFGMFGTLAMLTQPAGITIRITPK